jgi:hypothetical protein
MQLLSSYATYAPCMLPSAGLRVFSMINQSATEDFILVGHKKDPMHWIAPVAGIQSHTVFLNTAHLLYINKIYALEYL